MRMNDYSKAFIELEQLLLSGEVDLETYQDTVKSIEGNADEKAENVAKMIENFENYMKMLKEEEDRLKKKRKTVEGKIEWLTNTLELYLKARKKKELKVGLYTLRYKNLPDVVEIEDENLIPEAYKEEVVTYKIPKNELKKALQDGENIPGAKLVTGREKFEVKK